MLIRLSVTFAMENLRGAHSDMTLTHSVAIRLMEISARLSGSRLEIFTHVSLPAAVLTLLINQAQSV